MAFDPEFLGDLFASVGPITTRKLFGGLGIYAEGKIIAVVLSTGALFVKGDAQSAVDYEHLGMERWTYTNKKTGKHTAMPYWQVPDSALDEPDEMAELAGLAMQTAMRSTN